MLTRPVALCLASLLAACAAPGDSDGDDLRVAPTDGALGPTAYGGPLDPTCPSPFVVPPDTTTIAWGKSDPNDACDRFITEILSGPPGHWASFRVTYKDLAQQRIAVSTPRSRGMPRRSRPLSPRSQRRGSRAPAMRWRP